MKTGIEHIVADEKTVFLERCINCKHYDPSPFPEYNGHLAVCRSDHPAEHGAGKIGRFTLAHSTCFERKENTP